MSLKNNKAEGKRIGKEFAEGFGIGLSEESIRAVTAMEDVYVELETLTKNASKNAEKLAKKQRERQLKNLKNALELELITEQEYYEKLKAFRDSSLRQGSDEWYKCTEEIASYNKRMADEIEEQYQKIIELREELAKSLKNDEPWFSTSKVRFKGLGENGQDLVYTNSELKDFREEILLLENYRDRIKELKALGGVPDGVFSDIAKMDAAEGLKFINGILDADDKTREKFLSGYREYENLAQKTALDVMGTLGQDALREEGIYIPARSGSGTDSRKFEEILTASFEHVPEAYFLLGEQSGQVFGEGFLSKIPEIMENARSYFAVAINEIAEKVSSAVRFAAEGAVTSVSNSYSNTYTFNSSKDTTTQQLNAARNAAVLTRLRGGNA